MPNFTEKAIKQAFLELLGERPLAQITVRDIVEKCGINRNSFYYHYADLPALIEEIVREEADRIIAQYAGADSLETCLNAAVDFAKNHQRAILHIYRSVNREIFETHLWEVCGYLVEAYGNTVFADHAVSAADRALILRLYRCECFGVVLEWMNGGMKADVGGDIRRLCELRSGVTEMMIARSLQQS